MTMYLKMPGNASFRLFPSLRHSWSIATTTHDNYIVTTIGFFWSYLLPKCSGNLTILQHRLCQVSLCAISWLEGTYFPSSSRTPKIEKDRGRRKREIDRDREKELCKRKKLKTYLLAIFFFCVVLHESRLWFVRDFLHNTLLSPIIACLFYLLSCNINWHFDDNSSCRRRGVFSTLPLSDDNVSLLPYFVLERSQDWN